MGSGNIFTPTNQVRLTNVAVVRLKRSGKRFEVACYKNKVAEWRSGIERDISNVFQIQGVVFLNVSKGQMANSEALISTFGHARVDEICLEILNKGEVQLSEKERNHALDALFRDVATHISGMCLNPSTNKPYPPTMVEKLMADAHVSLSVYAGASTNSNNLSASVSNSTDDTNASHVNAAALAGKSRTSVESGKQKDSKNRTSTGGDSKTKADGCDRCMRKANAGKINDNADYGNNSADDDGWNDIKSGDLKTSKGSRQSERKRVTAKSNPSKSKSCDCDNKAETQTNESSSSSKSKSKSKSKRLPAKDREDSSAAFSCAKKNDSAAAEFSAAALPATNSNHSVAGATATTSGSKPTKVIAKEVIAKLQACGIPIVRARMRVRISAPVELAAGILAKFEDQIQLEENNQTGGDISNSHEKSQIASTSSMWVAEIVIDPGIYKPLADYVHLQSCGSGSLVLLNTRVTQNKEVQNP